MLLSTQPRSAFLYPSKHLLFVSVVPSVAPCLHTSELTPWLMSQGYCFVIGSLSRCGFATRSCATTFEDVPGCTTQNSWTRCDTLAYISFSAMIFNYFLMIFSLPSDFHHTCHDTHAFQDFSSPTLEKCEDPIAQKRIPGVKLARGGSRVGPR